MSLVRQTYVKSLRKPDHGIMVRGLSALCPQRLGCPLVAVVWLRKCCLQIPRTRASKETFETNLSNPKPGHTTGGSGRGARRNGRAGSGRIACQQNSSPRKHKSRVPSKESQKRRLSVSPEARTGEILCKPMEEQNPRLTRG